jgi:hypothetical protein
MATDFGPLVDPNLPTDTQHLSLNSPTPPQCSIALWRGYVTAQFYAWNVNSGDVLCLSPTFPTWRLPWQRSVPMREDPKALAALKALEAELVSRDWVRMGREPGSEWYEYRFRLGGRPLSKDAAAA